MITHEITFIDRDNNSCRVTIYDTESSSTRFNEMRAATNPFTTIEDSDDDILKPIRTTKARIRFVGTHEALSAFDLTSDHRYRVVFSRIGPNIPTWKTEWTGWLKAEVLTQEYSSTASEITLNAIDDLEIMKSWHLSQEDAIITDAEGNAYPITKGPCLRSMRDMIMQALCRTSSVIGAEDRHYISFEGSLFPVEIGKMLNLRVNDFLFYSANSSDMSGTMFETSTMYDVMTEVCKTFGYSLRCIGQTFFFTRHFNNARYTEPITMSEFATGISTQPTINEENAETPAAPGSHSMSVYQGASGARVNVSMIPYDNANIIAKTEGGEVKHRDGFKNTYPGMWKWRIISMENVEPHIYAYVPRLNIFVNDDAALNAQRLTELTNTGECAGCIIASDDYWYGPDATPGSAKRGETKRNYDFTTRMYFRAGPGYGKATLDVQTPSLVIKGSSPVHLTSGGINISFNIGESDNMPYVRNTYTWITVRCMLRIGNKWWNGGTWQASSAQFSINVHEDTNPVNVPSNKILSWDFVANGYAIPINEELNGIAEFTIICITTRNDPDEPSNACVMTDFSLEYCPHVDYILGDVNGELKTDYTYENHNDVFASDAYSVDLLFHTQRNGIDAIGNLVDEDGRMFMTSNNNTRLEDALLDLYMSRANCSMRTYSIYTDVADFAPYKVTHPGVDNGLLAALPIAYEINWRSLVAKIKYTQLI